MKAIRFILAVIAGLVAWLAVATIVNLGIRAAMPDYAAVERAMTFTLPMLLARLGIGVIASIAAGMVAALVQGPGRWAAEVASFILLAFFIPVHFMLWEKFPYWYHLFFLLSLTMFSTLGAVIVTRARMEKVA
jgi:hypothetical protein